MNRPEGDEAFWVAVVGIVVVNVAFLVLVGWALVQLVQWVTAR